jgi:DNA-binding response OmpR family regulator
MDSIGLPMEAARIGMIPGRLSEVLGFDQTPVRVGHVELWPSEGRLSVDGQDVHLAPREFELLRVLVLGAGHVLSRERLHAAVWGTPMPHARDRCVDVTVRKIRGRLLEAAPRWDYIHTHVGYGYRFQPARRRDRA